MILFLHHRYRLAGGEERAVDDLARLVREELGEPVEVLHRRSEATSRARAALGVVTGGLAPDDVAAAVRRTGARIVHAHNLQPTYGWRALAAARQAGAAIVLHLHQYRLVCAIGTCHRDGEDCTRCHGRNTLPGVRLNCRGSWPEALAYGVGLAAWQRRTAASADAVLVPSRFAGERLATLGAPVDDPIVMPHPVWEPAAPVASLDGTPAAPFALMAGRLVGEKGVEVAVQACQRVGMPLLIAGEGPERLRLHGRYPPSQVRFLGRLEPPALAAVRLQAAIALMPSLSAESFGLAAAEAMAAGVPVAASRMGALPELLPAEWLVAPGDPAALAAAMTRILADPDARQRARARISAIAAPRVVAQRLAAVYDEVTAARSSARPARPRASAAAARFRSG